MNAAFFGGANISYKRAARPVGPVVPQAFRYGSGGATKAARGGVGAALSPHERGSVLSSGPTLARLQGAPTFFFTSHLRTVTSKS